MQITLNPEDLTRRQRAEFYKWFVGHRVWFSLSEEETYFTNDHQERTRPKRLVATVIGVGLPPLVDTVDLITSEGVLHEGDWFTMEPYQRFDNDGKDRYAPS